VKEISPSIGRSRVQRASWESEQFLSGKFVLNLVLNAIKAAERQVTVLIVSDPVSLNIHVTNDGQSISAQREFVVPTQDETGRTGLGLWVCFQLTKQLNGSLDIAPIPGDGGTVAVFEAPLENLYA